MRRSREVSRALVSVALVVAAVVSVSVLTPDRASAATPPAGFGEGSGFCSSAVPGGYTLGANFDNVYACGPANNSGTGYDVPASGTYMGFFEGAPWSYQCVELANRFIFDIYGIGPIYGTTLVGGNYVATFHSKYPSIGVGSSPGTSLPVAGDVISMWGGSSGQSENGTVSHVAVVTGVAATSTGWKISVMEENASSSGSNSITVSSSGSWSYGGGYYTDFDWLELGSGQSGVPGNGSFVQVSGQAAIYRIAGGAPLYVSNWTAVGGVQQYAVISQSQFDQLQPVPVNGTMIRDYATGAIYEIAGGAPLYVSPAGCVALACTTGLVNVDDWDVANITNPAAHLNAVPANGTMIRDYATGAIYEIAGGAPLYVSAAACPALACSIGDVNVDDWDLANITNPAAHLNAVPTNGTMINDIQTGNVYEIAGGAPLYVSAAACPALACSSNDVNVDDWDLANITNPASHLNAVPTNGTMINDIQTGTVYEIAGGAPLYVSAAACPAVSCLSNLVNVDDWDLVNITNPAAHLNSVPANGTFLSAVTSGAVYRTAGGAPLPITDCTDISGCPGTVRMDGWDIANDGSAVSHLNVAPSDGTVVEGLPSGSFWEFIAGTRQPVASSGTAVVMNDPSVTQYPQGPTVTDLSPAAVVNGTSESISITGTGFEAGASLTTSTSGVTFTSVVVNSSSSMSAEVVATASAPAGMINVTVTNPDGASGTCTDCLTVTPSTPTPTPPPAPSGTTTVKSQKFTTPTATGTLTDSAIGLTVSTQGTGALTVGAYTSNPTGTALSSGTGTYLDVEVATGSAFTSLSIKVCSLGTGTTLEWWNGTTWLPFTNLHLSTGCLVVTVTATTTPDLAQLTGTPIGVVHATPTRIYGKTADATAAAELEQVFAHTGATATCAGGTGSHAVVLARDTFFSDALASQDLAQFLGTGTLLTPRTRLSTPTITALRVEGIQTVYVIGGPLAITTTVVKAIESLPAYACGGASALTTTGKPVHLSVHRLFGQTEYGTAATLATFVGSAPKLTFSGAYQGVNATGGNGRFNDTAGKASSAAGGTTLPTAILATGTSWMDAESASALSYTDGVPILLTPAASLSPTAKTALQKLGIKQVIIMGGQLAVSNTVEKALTAMGISVLRVAGKDYTDTAAKLATFELSAGANGLGWEPAHTGLVAARGDFYTDGLAGAVLERPGATSQTPLLLTFDPSKLGTYATAFLKAAGTTGAGIGTDHETLTHLSVLGGPIAVTTATVQTMQADLTP